MRDNLLATAFILSSVVLLVSGCSEVLGNLYCNPVDAILYSNVGSPGTYNQVTDMASNGICSSTPKSFSGPISPLDEEVSFHFRGPLRLKQFAVYTPSTTTTRKEKRDGSTARRRRYHQHLEKHAKAGNKKRDEIHATIDGQIVSWDNNWPTPGLNAYDGGAVPVTATIDSEKQTWINNWFGPSTSTMVSQASTTISQVMSQSAAAGSKAQETSTSSIISSSTTSFSKPQSFTSASLPESQVSASATASTTAVGSGSYSRIGYYDSVEQTLDNLVFLGNYGGQGSGVFNEAYGASLSFVDSNGTGGASSPQILADTTLPSDSEIIVMLDEECNNDCGYVRPGSVAYHGFNGANKVFLLEFSMPIDGTTGFNADMPSVWILNAQIPRTIQYGNPSCSCWESGCGEFDIAEALNAGSTFLKSTIHTNKPGGDSDYFVRPTSSTMRLAVVFSSATSTIHLQKLPTSYEFPTSLTADDIQNICDTSGGSKLSEFAIS
ncbi:96f09121-de62-402b-b8d4-8d082bf913ba [Sclerotinia trifoliorum]|uniref:glucan endo-1,3-beta-D-glucosidase n=1 Tax=Sclerotinia trifoliorum TaxID=28548 RepID=A0A8H2ZPQ7_9HELO|nr:96f09121-de62-402b-b8d4-8d082bf913ba [Sclerotinia trifoliorum]